MKLFKRVSANCATIRIFANHRILALGYGIC